MKKTLLQLVFITAGGSCLAQPIAFSDTLFYTGSEQQYTIPSCAADVVITAYGAQGAAGSTLNPGTNFGGMAGLGNRVTGTWNFITPGSTLYVYVGGAANGGTGGYNGGGEGIATAGVNPSGGGGGATDVRWPSNALVDRVQVAGGGGGGGNAAYHWTGAPFTGGNGGNGGGNQALYGSSLDGATGEDVTGDSGFTYTGGFGGTSAGPGAGGAGCSGFLGQSGGAATGEVGGIGGLGSSLTNVDYKASGGAGGGGFTGGNGGGGGSAGTTGCSGNNIGAGGGGSAGTNLFNGNTPTDFDNGVRSGDGMVIVQYTITPGIATLSTSATPCVSDQVALSYSPAGGTFTVLQGNAADVTSFGIFTPSAIGTYEIAYTVTDTCTNLPIADTLTIDVNCDYTGLDEVSANSFEIYPNPAENTVFIKATTVLGEISIVDVKGQVVFATEANTSMIEVDVRNLDAGCYFVRTNGNTQRFIVK